MSAPRILLAAAALLLAIAQIAAPLQDAELHGGLLQQLGVIFTLPLGAGLLLQLYVSYLAVALLIAYREGRAGALLAAPILLFGHAWTLAYLAWRWPQLTRRAPPAA